MSRKTETVAFSVDRMTLKKMKELTAEYDVGVSTLVCNLINEKAAIVEAGRSFVHQWSSGGCDEVIAWR